MDRYDLLCEIAKKKGKGVHILDYAIGVGLCGVSLDNGKAGVAYTDRKSIPWGCSLYDELPKAGAPVEDFIEMSNSSDVLMNALGMATINACINDGDFERADVMDAVSISKNDVVGMVGYFDPMVSQIKKMAKELYIFEKERTLTTWPQKALSPDQIPDLIPACNVLLISATTLMNKTFDSIIKYSKTDRIVILGPSAPVCTEAFPEVKVFGATIVTPKALKVIYHGGGTRNLYIEKAGWKVVFVKNKSV